MQIIKKNLKQGEVVVKVNSQEDLWFLNQVVEEGDLIKGRTERKIKLSTGGSDGKQTAVKKTIFLEIKAEKKEFDPHSDALRISGISTLETEDVAKGSHHTFDVSPGDVITIVKQEWPNYQLDKLREAAENIKTRIILLIFDRESAIFAMLKNQGYEILAKLKGEVAKKGVDEGGKDFYKELAEKLKEYSTRLEPQNIIVASPSFWKEYLMKEIDDDVKKKITLATCSDVEENAINEVLQRPELLKVLENDRAAKELGMVEEVLKSIHDSMACYGLKECREKADIGAIKEMIVSYSFINDARQAGKSREVESVMRLGEKTGAHINIISTDEADQKLKGLGGIAGILRWKMEN